jgi:hypothetical protein
MERCLKIVALALGVAAATVLSIFGFAIWVFIPLLPAAIVYLVAVCSINRTKAVPGQNSEKQQDKAA